MNSNEILENHEARLRNHAERLKNQDETLRSLAELIGVIKSAMDAQQEIFEGLQRAVATRASESLPPDEPVN